MQKPNKVAETTAQYIHRKRLEASLARGLLMNHMEFYKHIQSLLAPDDKEKVTAFMLYLWELGRRVPSVEQENALTGVLGN